MVKLRARHWHHIETFSDMIAGFIINLVLVHTVLHWMGYEISVNQNISMGLIIFCFSYVRKYTLRRIFNGIIGKQYGIFGD